jgi:NAD(P)-dependent dehydrogenase (short-subunit alcohol dehydrogenase family)
MGMALTKTFMVTGGNTGLGFECAYALNKDSSALVIIACRDVQKGEKAARRLREAKGNAKVLSLDLSRQASSRTSERANFLR